MVCILQNKISFGIDGFACGAVESYTWLQANLFLQKFWLSNWIKSINTKNYKTQQKLSQLRTSLLGSIFMFISFHIYF
jgi:hypothetical protein